MAITSADIKKKVGGLCDLLGMQLEIFIGEKASNIKSFPTRDHNPYHAMDVSFIIDKTNLKKTNEFWSLFIDHCIPDIDKYLNGKVSKPYPDKQWMLKETIDRYILEKFVVHIYRFLRSEEKAILKAINDILMPGKIILIQI